jgi:hypothetical protein
VIHGGELRKPGRLLLPTEKRPRERNCMGPTDGEDGQKLARNTEVVN